MKDIAIRLALISSLFIATLALNGCASSGYTRTCDWCDEASQAQLKTDLVECNRIASRQVPYSTVSRETGRIVVSHGSTTCRTNKKNATTCSTTPSYTYPEKETVDVTDYGARKAVFDTCIDTKAKSYRPQVAPKQFMNSSVDPPEDEKYTWNLQIPPELVNFDWSAVSEGPNSKIFYISTNKSSIQEDGSRRVIWVLQDVENSDAPKVRSIIAQMEVDCEANRMRGLVAYGFSEQMGKGDSIGRVRLSSESSEGAWKAFPPSVHNMQNFRRVCTAGWINMFKIER